MIVSVGSLKGAPGVTTLVTALGLVCPASRVVIELDPRGADLPYRLSGVDGRPMSAVPSVAGLAVDARPGSGSLPIGQYAQQTALGVPVIRGEASGRSEIELARHLPGLATALATWPGVAFADLGELHPASSAMAAARSSVVTLLLVRPSVEGLGHLRSRIDELTAAAGDSGRTRISLGVVVATDARDAKRGVARTAALLAHLGSPVPVLGAFCHDPSAAAALWSGPLSRRLARSALLQSARGLLPTLAHRWPELVAATAASDMPAAAGAGVV